MLTASQFSVLVVHALRCSHSNISLRAHLDPLADWFPIFCSGRTRVALAHMFLFGFSNPSSLRMLVKYPGTSRRCGAWTCSSPAALRSARRCAASAGVSFSGPHSCAPRPRVGFLPSLLYFLPSRLFFSFVLSHYFVLWTTVLLSSWTLRPSCSFFPSTSFLGHSLCILG